MNARDLERLIFNPFHTSNLIHHCLSGFQSKNPNGIKWELVYLILPILYNGALSEKLSALNKNSRLNTFLENSKNYSYILNQLNERLPEYRNLTNQALLVLTKTAGLKIAPFLWCNGIDFHGEQSEDLRKLYKASYNLGLVLAKESYFTIFLKFRITNI